jgi:DNA-binding MarR family transcriptional regulator
MRPSIFSRAAALALALLLSLSLAPLSAFADEGMFLPDAISKLPFDKLAKRGLKLAAKEIYDPSGVSLKDAIVIVGGGTGEFISPEGLLLTNHHVAFEALVSASTPANNYGTNGYTAKNRAEELPAHNYTVTITEDIKDVTSDVLEGVTDTMPARDRAALIQKRLIALEKRDAGNHLKVRVMPMNDGQYYYQFTYTMLRDVRVVYAPPKSIGYFGGDIDNFEWPRHCGDFTFMRAYVGPDGQPADYSPNNVPFKPKKFLTLSMNGVKEGDFTMVLGYPGTTRRYRESYSVAYNQDIIQPFFVDLNTRQIDILQDIGRRDPTQRAKLQSTIFDLSNTQKNYAGSVQAMRRAGLVEKKRADEAAFARWVEATPERKAKYGEALPTIDKTYNQLLKSAQHDQLLQQFSLASNLLNLAFYAQQFAVEKEKPEAERNPNLMALIQRMRNQIPRAIADRKPTYERELLIYLLAKANELPAGQKIDFIEKQFGSLQGNARRLAEEDFARAVLDSKRFLTNESLSGLFELSMAQLRESKEPLVDFVLELGADLQRYQAQTQVFNATIGRWRPLLVAGIGEMHGVKTYPDANRTLRFTYGEVKGYVPREAILYKPFTTLSGIVEKDTGREPFEVPEKLKQLFRAKDFGAYALPGRADVPVGFLSTVDIIAGSSGSPVLNGRGQQVGIVFDGNYEGLGNDFFYNEDKGRTISVDIRYVLFIADKFGGAGYLLKEMNFAGASPATTRAMGSSSR